MPVVLKKWSGKIIDQYQLSATKPDKVFSVLPTVLKLMGDVSGKKILDLGCGDGFFTKQIALSGAAEVVGIDNSESQLELAQKEVQENVLYVCGDIFVDTLPAADCIVAPFVLNYAKDAKQLFNFFERLWLVLNNGGKIILVYDLPNGNNLERFGARKSVVNKKDGAEMEIELFNEGKHICTIPAFYYFEPTIMRLLQMLGFKNITTHIPIISPEGMKKYGESFWKGYAENCELGYLTAEKII